LVLWLLGYPALASRRCEEMLAIARDIGHPYSLAWALSFAAWLHQYRREPEQVRKHAEGAIALAKEHGFALFAAMGTMFRGWAISMQGEGAAGVAEMRRGYEDYRRTGAESSRGHWCALLAEAHHAAGQIDEGLAALAGAGTEETGERYYEAELHRLRGELLLARTPGDAIVQDEAERSFHQALAVARAQNAKSLELRAATSLARMGGRPLRSDEARRTLAQVHGWFTEGFDTADLAGAATLLKEERT
jgi:predicted ATPase